MKRIDDMAVWVEACLDTPIGSGGPGFSEEQAFRHPGNHVKSRELDTGQHSFPKYHGILVHYDEAGIGAQGGHTPPGGFVVVRSVGSPVSLPGTVWTGSISDYAKMWQVD